MASTRSRQRKLARAKLDRQMARRAARERRRRQLGAGAAIGVVLLLAAGLGVWAMGGFGGDNDEDTTAAKSCAWTPQNLTDNPNLKDVGNPETTEPPTTGTETMTVTFNPNSPVTVDLELAKAPCAGASLAHLANKKFFDNTKCHEILEEGALRCGDPSGTGLGGPTYSFFNENVPVAVEPSASPATEPAADAAPLYPKGTVALIGNPPGSNGSQFLIFFKDFNPAEPSYPVVGKVTSGLEAVEAIGAKETVDNGSGVKIKPKEDVVINSLTVEGAGGSAPASAPPPDASAPAADPSASAAS